MSGTGVTTTKESGATPDASVIHIGGSTPIDPETTVDFNFLGETTAKWYTAMTRLIGAQLVFSLLMQLSYVAFPAYNFALGVWGLTFCSPKWLMENRILSALFLGALSFSILTDFIWMGLWVSGTVFYDQFCGAEKVTLVSCGGATGHFPGCNINRFALVMMLLNDLAKGASIVCIARVRSKALNYEKSMNFPSGSSAEVHQMPVTNSNIINSPADIAVSTGAASVMDSPRVSPATVES